MGFLRGNLQPSMIMRQLSRTTLLLLLNSAASAAFAFLLAALLARATGAAGLGTYALALAWVFSLRLLAEFGTNTLLLRDLSAQAAEPTWGAAAAVRTALGTVLVVLLVLAAPLVSSAPAALQLAAPLILVEPLFGAHSAALRAQGRAGVLVALNGGMYTVQLALTALALAGGAGVLTALALNTLTSALQAAAAWLTCRPIGRIPLPPRAQVDATLRRAAPFAAAGVLAALHARAGTVLVERLATLAAAGDLSAAGRLVDTARLPPQAYFDALFPALVAATPPERARLTTRALRRAAAYGVIFAAAMTLTADFLLNLLFGTGFAAAALPLMLLAWSLPPALCKGVWTIDHYARGQETFVNRVTLVTLLLRAALSVAAIPLWGAAGAAGAALLVESISAVWLWRRNV